MTTLLSIIFIVSLGEVGMVYASIGTPDEDADAAPDEDAAPVLRDLNLKAEQVVEGLDQPTAMAFLGPEDILVVERRSATIQRIANGNLLQIDIPELGEQTLRKGCLCGISTSSNEHGTEYIFLYYYLSNKADDTNKSLGSYLYRYELVDNQLTDPKMLLFIPGEAGERHNGGAIAIGPDNNVYVPGGDNDGNETKASNINDAPDPIGAGGILRLTQDGEAVNGSAIIGSIDPLNKYYAYGIRNSFGLDFDPVTGNLWNTDNGPEYGDEINLVEPGFNGGWKKVMGMSSLHAKPDFNDLVDFGGKGKYGDPKFEWRENVGPTAIVFLHSDKLGKQYENDMFVGNMNTGNIHHFELNQNRTELILNGPLQDKVADTTDELEQVTFAEGFGGISDLEVGPEGYLYAVSIIEGKIFRIVPALAS